MVKLVVYYINTTADCGHSYCGTVGTVMHTVGTVTVDCGLWAQFCVYIINTTYKYNNSEYQTISQVIQLLESRQSKLNQLLRAGSSYDLAAQGLIINTTIPWTRPPPPSWFQGGNVLNRAAKSGLGACVVSYRCC